MDSSVGGMHKIERRAGSTVRATSNYVNELREDGKVKEVLRQELDDVVYLLLRMMRDYDIEFPVRITVETEPVPYLGYQLVGKMELGADL